VVIGSLAIAFSLYAVARGSVLVPPVIALEVATAIALILSSRAGEVLRQSRWRVAQRGGVRLEEYNPSRAR
jgi:hypothetical protein